MTDTVFILGASGLIGSALKRRLTERGADVIAPPRAELDLAAVAPDWTPPRADVAFLLAAHSHLRTCEDDPQGTRAVNVTATARVAEAFVRRGTRVILASSSLVFDGETPFRRPDDPRAPGMEYGRQKALAEDAVLALGPLGAVVRMSKVIGPEMPLLRNWVAALKAGAPITAFADKVTAPLSDTGAAEVLDQVARAGVGGIHQASASRDVSFLEAGLHVARRLGADPALVRDSKKDFDAMPPAWNPRHTTLAPGPTLEKLGWRAPDPFDVLDACLGREHG